MASSIGSLETLAVLPEAVSVAAEGMTILASPENPIADIVFIHGVQGHPRRTWTHSSGPESPRTLSRIFKSASSRERAEELTPPPTRRKECFWPQDLLPSDFPKCRISTYGYDSMVSKFFEGAANKTNLLGHGNSLLNALVAHRRDMADCPLIVIAHSLGGLLLKEALRRSWQAHSYEKPRREIYDATSLLVFMGTPHRGSDWAPWGMMMQALAKTIGFDTSSRILRELRVDSGLLEVLRSDFAAMLRDEQFEIWSFLEGRGLRGIQGLNGKVVDDSSSRLGDAREKWEVINANHMDMCRFRDYDDPGYIKVRNALASHLNDSTKRRKTDDKTGSQTPNSDSSPTEMQLRQSKARYRTSHKVVVDGTVLLDSLIDGETRIRIEQISRPHTNTLEWLFSNKEIGFMDWLQSGSGLYWIKGKPASGKSTLMKYALTDPRTRDALAGSIIASFFFHDRGSEFQKSFEGMLKGTICECLQQLPQLQEILLSTFGPALQREGKGFDWTYERLSHAFELICSQNTFDADICLFVDALDEYKGNHRDMVRFLRRIVTADDLKGSRTRIRACVSSRPHQVFLDGLSDCPGFALQHYTKDDINSYIDSRLSEAQRLVEMKKSSLDHKQEQYNDLIAEVARKADGVFLWVRLALDEILDNCANGSTIEELLALLERIPDDLRAVYKRIFDQISDSDRNEVMRILRIINSGVEISSMECLFIAKVGAIPTVEDALSCAMGFEFSEEDAMRFIRHRSRGLVEFHRMRRQHHNIYLKSNNQSNGTLYRPSLIHQTVRAFILGNARLGNPFRMDPIELSVREATFRAYTISLLGCQRGLSCVPETVKEEVSKSDNVQLHFGISNGLIQLHDSYHDSPESPSFEALFPFLDVLSDSTIHELLYGIWCTSRPLDLDKINGTHIQKNDKIIGDVTANSIDRKLTEARVTNIFELSVHICLTRYVRYRLAQFRPHSMASFSKPLLHFMLGSGPSGLQTFFHLKSGGAELLRLLIENGADMAMKHKGLTAFEYFFQHGDSKCNLLSRVYAGVKQLQGSNYRYEEQRYFLRGDVPAMIRCFLENGQDPNPSMEITDPEYSGAGLAPLHIAARTRYSYLVELLTEHGAFINCLSRLGRTPLDEALEVTQCVEYHTAFENLIQQSRDGPPRSFPPRTKAQEAMVKYTNQHDLPPQGLDYFRDPSTAWEEILRDRHAIGDIQIHFDTITSLLDRGAKVAKCINPECNPDPREPKYHSPPRFIITENDLDRMEEMGIRVDRRVLNLPELLFEWNDEGRPVPIPVPEPEPDFLDDFELLEMEGCLEEFECPSPPAGGFGSIAGTLSSLGSRVMGFAGGH